MVKHKVEVIILSFATDFSLNGLGLELDNWLEGINVLESQHRK